MKLDSPQWWAVVIVVGLVLAAVAGFQAMPHIGPLGGAMWALWLTYVLTLAIGANRLQVWLLQPPVAAWKSACVGLCAFIPMLLGWFPVSNWAMDIAATTRYEYLPSPLWILVLMLWGFVAPGGALFDALRRIAGKR